MKINAVKIVFCGDFNAVLNENLEQHLLVVEADLSLGIKVVEKTLRGRAKN